MICKKCGRPELSEWPDDLCNACYRAGKAKPTTWFEIIVVGSVLVLAIGGTALFTILKLMALWKYVFGN